MRNIGESLDKEIIKLYLEKLEKMTEEERAFFFNQLQIMSKIMFVSN